MKTTLRFTATAFAALITLQGSACRSHENSGADPTRNDANAKHATNEHHGIAITESGPAVPGVSPWTALAALPAAPPPNDVKPPPVPSEALAPRKVGRPAQKRF